MALLKLVGKGTLLSTSRKSMKSFLLLLFLLSLLLFIFCMGFEELPNKNGHTPIRAGSNILESFWLISSLLQDLLLFCLKPWLSPQDASLMCSDLILICGPLLWPIIVRFALWIWGHIVSFSDSPPSISLVQLPFLSQFP